MNQENNQKRQSQLSKGGFPLVQKQGSSLAELQARNSKRQADYLKGEGQQQRINYNNNHNDQSNYNNNSHGVYEQDNGEILALRMQKNSSIIDIQNEQELKQLMNKMANSARTDIPQKVNPILSNSSYYIEQILAEKEQLRIDNISLFEIIQQQNQRIQQLVIITNQLQHQQSKQLHHQHPQAQISPSPQSLSPQSTAADYQCSQSNERYESYSKLSGNSNLLRYPNKNDCDQQSQQSQQKTNEIDSLSCTFRKEQLFQGSQPQQDIKNGQNNNFGKRMSQPNNQNSNNKSIFKQFEQQIQNIKEYDIQQQQSQENNKNNNNLQISNDNNQYDNMDNNNNMHSQELNSNLMVQKFQEQIQSLQQSLRESLIEKNQLRENVQALEQQSEMYTTLKRDYQELIGLVQQLGEEWADYEEQKQCIIFKQEEEEQLQQENHQLKTINPKQTTQVCMNCLSMLKQYNLIIEELKQRIKHNEYNSTQEKVKLNEQINMLQIQNKKLLDSQ